MSLRRRMTRAPSSHTDDWLLTYADTITLLLCLFVVLLAAQVHKPGLGPDPMPAAVAVEQPVVPANFVDWKLPFQPAPLVNKGPDDDADTGTEDRTALPLAPDSVQPIAAHPAPPVQTIAGEPANLQPVDPPALAGSIPQPAPAPTILPDAAPQQAHGGPPTPLSEIAAQMRPEGVAHLEQKGDRITSLAFDSAALFSRGDATLNASGKVILQDVVGNLKSEDYRDYNITIEGHTDDAPISTTQFPSNWELSSARAAAVVRFLIEQGVTAQRLRAAGYADTRPLQPNRDGNGMVIPENQAKNRRVVIELEKIEHQ